MTIRKTIPLFVVLLLLGTTALQANKVTKIGIAPASGDAYKNGPTVSAYSKDGKKYHYTATTGNASKTRIRINTKGKCRWSKKGSKDKIRVTHFKNLSDTLAVWHMDGKWHTISATLQYTGGSGYINPVTKCNTELQRRIDSGGNRSAILSKGFKLKIADAYQVSFLLKCPKTTKIGRPDTGLVSRPINATIYCRPSPHAQPKPKIKKTKLKPLIKSIIFSASPRTYTGRCPVGIRFHGSITSNHAGTVKYQYSSNDNKKSPVLTLKFPKAGTKAVRLWSRVIKAPKTGRQLSADGRQLYDYRGWTMIKILSPLPSLIKKASFKIKCGTTTKRGIEHEDIGGARKRPGRTKY